jgi:micrococcal nuclease
MRIPCIPWNDKRALLAAMVGVAFLLPMVHSPASAEPYRIVKVYDGDTVQAERSGVVVYIMLVGIDAPEISVEMQPEGQPYAEEAKAYLSELVLGKDVHVEGYGVGAHPDRDLIGVLLVDGVNANLALVKRGLAEALREGLPAGFQMAPYVRAEEEAKARKIGMWSLGEAYLSPATWRQMHRKAARGTPTVRKEPAASPSGR